MGFWVWALGASLRAQTVTALPCTAVPCFEGSLSAKSDCNIHAEMKRHGTGHCNVVMCNETDHMHDHGPYARICHMCTEKYHVSSTMPPSTYIWHICISISHIYISYIWIGQCHTDRSQTHLLSFIFLCRPSSWTRKSSPLCTDI